MEIPLQIRFHGLPPSEAVEERIRHYAAGLGDFYDRITSCRVVVERPHRSRSQGNLYRVAVDVTLPGGEVVVSRTGRLDSAHQDPYVAIRDAFKAAKRQVRDYNRRQRGLVKTHELPPHGTVSELYPEEGYGFIAAADGREIYFHKNAVLGVGFDGLEIGNPVRFAEEPGEKGPKATSVTPMGRLPVP